MLGLPQSGRSAFDATVRCWDRPDTPTVLGALSHMVSRSSAWSCQGALGFIDSAERVLVWDGKATSGRLWRPLAGGRQTDRHEYRLTKHGHVVGLHEPEDNRVTVWDLDGKLVSELPYSGSQFTNVQVSPDGGTLAEVDNWKEIHLWSRSGSFIGTLAGAISCLAFSPDGKMLATGSRDGAVRLWEASSGRPIVSDPTGHSDAVNSLDFNASSTLLVSGSSDGTVRLWNIDWRTALATHAHRLLQTAPTADDLGGDLRSYVETLATRAPKKGPFFQPRSEPQAGHRGAAPATPASTSMASSLPEVVRSALGGTTTTPVRHVGISRSVNVSGIITGAEHADGRCKRPIADNSREIFRLPRSDASEMEMALIPAGHFTMGSTWAWAQDDEKPPHRVYLEAFYIDKLEVTNRQYRRFTQATGHREPESWSDSRLNGDNQPVVGVNWYDASAYCAWAGKRLPTEAEWENAARGGLEAKEYPWGDEEPKGKCCFDDRSVKGSYLTSNSRLQPMNAASYAPNGYGLYDMVGNVFEWCQDWYDDEYYASSPQRNPQGPSHDDARVIRSGGFANWGGDLRCSSRAYLCPTASNRHVGFRCAKSVRPEGSASRWIGPMNPNAPGVQPDGVARGNPMQWLGPTLRGPERAPHVWRPPVALPRSKAH